MPRTPDSIPDLPERLAAVDQAVADLARAITRVRRLAPISRAREAGKLAKTAPKVMSQLIDAAVAEATRTASWDDVARELNVEPSIVGKRLRRFRGTWTRSRKPAPSAVSTD